MIQTITMPDQDTMTICARSTSSKPTFFQEAVCPRSRPCSTRQAGLRFASGARRRLRSALRGNAAPLAPRFTAAPPRGSPTRLPIHLREVVGILPLLLRGGFRRTAHQRRAITVRQTRLPQGCLGNHRTCRRPAAGRTATASTPCSPLNSIPPFPTERRCDLAALHRARGGRTRLVADRLTRAAIRHLCRERLRTLELAGTKVNPTDKLLRSMTTGPIAVETAKANEQHHKLPQEFFGLILGPRRISCCYWPPDVQQPRRRRGRGSGRHMRAGRAERRPARARLGLRLGRLCPCVWPNATPQPHHGRLEFDPAKAVGRRRTLAAGTRQRADTSPRTSTIRSHAARRGRNPLHSSYPSRCSSTCEIPSQFSNGLRAGCGRMADCSFTCFVIAATHIGSNRKVRPTGWAVTSSRAE